VIPSRELCEARKLGYANELFNYLMKMNVTRPKAPALEYLLGMAGLMSVRLNSSWGLSYLDNKPFRLHHRVHRYQRLNGGTTLFNLKMNESFNASRPTSEILGKILDEGLTIRQLADQHAAIYADGESQIGKLRELVGGWLEKEMIVLNVPPPEEDMTVLPALARLQTNLGPITIELLAAQAPRAVASFVHLARYGYYDGMAFRGGKAGLYAAIGAYDSSLPESGPGYTLPYEPTPVRHERGSVALFRINTGNHASRFQICLQPLPERDGRQTIFGRIVAGIDVADRLLGGDYILSIDWPLGEPSAISSQQSAKNSVVEAAKKLADDSLVAGTANSDS